MTIRQIRNSSNPWGTGLFKEQALEYLGKFIPAGLFRVSPTANLDDKIAACDLTLRGNGNGHFIQFPPAPKNDWIKKGLQCMFQKLEGRQLMAHVGMCAGAMVVKVASILGCEGSNFSPRILSESELRYTIGDPIMDMLIQCWGYQVKNKIL